MIEGPPQIISLSFQFFRCISKFNTFPIFLFKNIFFRAQISLGKIENKISRYDRIRSNNHHSTFSYVAQKKCRNKSHTEQHIEHKRTNECTRITIELRQAKRFRFQFQFNSTNDPKFLLFLLYLNFDQCPDTLNTIGTVRMRINRMIIFDCVKRCTMNAVYNVIYLSANNRIQIRFPHRQQKNIIKINHVFSTTKIKCEDNSKANTFCGAGELCDCGE